MPDASPASSCEAKDAVTRCQRLGSPREHGAEQAPVCDGYPAEVGSPRVMGGLDEGTRRFVRTRPRQTTEIRVLVFENRIGELQVLAETCLSFDDVEQTRLPMFVG